MIRNFEIHNDRLKSVKYPKGVTGNVNTYICHFDIACDIPDLLWFCIFKQGETVYRQIIENDTCKIPQEVLVNTDPLYIGCYGTNANDEIKRVSTNLIFFDVKEGAYSESTLPDTPTPDVWETLVSKTIPIIGENGNWYIFSMNDGKYIDSGVRAYGYSLEDKAELTEYIDEQTEIIKSDVEGIQKQINEHAHFKGYKATNAEILEIEATPNDFAYSAESGTKWIYSEEDGWQDSGATVPDQLTPASNTTPLINGEASAGKETSYARGDHRHPTDTTRASAEELNDLKDTKADKTQIIRNISTAYNFTFSNNRNSEVRLGEMTSISFTFGDGEYAKDYTSGLSFDSGATPTAIDYTDSGILNWVGTDCTTSNGLSIFQPSANTHYDIVFYFNGVQFIGLVNGFVPATGNEAV